MRNMDSFNLIVVLALTVINRVSLKWVLTHLSISFPFSKLQELDMRITHVPKQFRMQMLL